MLLNCYDKQIFSPEKETEVSIWNAIDCDFK